MKYRIGLEYVGQSVKEFLKDVPRKRIKRIKTAGNILVNGKPVTVRYQLQKGDYLELVDPVEKNRLRPYAYPLDILYEDEYYLIVDKPRGMPSIPSRKYPDKTLANALTAYYQDQGIVARIHLVNRLDKDTEGLLLVAKSAQAHQILSQNIKQVKRVYRCLVEGRLRESGTVDQPIFKSETMIKRVVDQRGQAAITHYRPIRVSGDTTLVECKLETGRTHQIRVHLAHLGYPIIGDTLYGTGNRLALRSCELSFEHPFFNKTLVLKRTKGFR